MLISFLSTLIVTLLVASHASGAAEEIQSSNGLSRDLPYGVIDSRLLPIGYSGDERLEYDISWSGGIKIGDSYDRG